MTELPKDVVVEMRKSQFRQAAGNSPKARADSFYRKMQKQDGSVAPNVTRMAPGFSGLLQAVNHRRNRKDGHGGCRY